MPIEHRATASVWLHFLDLPAEIRARAEKQFALLKSDPQHPSLQLKKLGDRHGSELWSARVTLGYRALALKQPYGYLWIWIGDHTSHEQQLS
jgi:hypothetical protein